jgi:hypothetical protein
MPNSPCFGTASHLFVLYPLSLGPAWSWVSSTKSEAEIEQRIMIVRTVYAPVIWPAENFEWTTNAFAWYITKWERHP